MMPSRAPLWMHRYLRWEQSLARQSNRLHRRRYPRAFFAACSRLGDGVVWYVLIAMMILLHGRAALLPMLALLASAGVGVLLYLWIKRKTARSRPLHVQTELSVSVVPLDRYSFPSGHTLHAVNFALQLVAFAPGFAWLLLPLALAIAASRLVLGLHYLSDVLVGALLGLALALFSLWLQGVF